MKTIECQNCKTNISRVRVNCYGRRECPKCGKLTISASHRQMRQQDAKREFMAAPYLYE